MTIDPMDIANTLEYIAKLLRDASSPVEPVDDPVYKSALLAVSQGGVEFLQRALCVNDDGIVGPDTRGALEKVDLSILIHDLTKVDTSPSAPIDPKSGLTDALRKEYRDLYAAAKITTGREQQVASIASRVKTAEIRTDVIDVSTKTGVPVRVICIMQALEANLDFHCHLHNGNSLRHRTVNVPAGRPIVGEPPFDWKTSAFDALHLKKYDEWHDWSIEGCAYIFEQYNGWGYRLYHPTVKSPYLWSFSTIYTSGKYVADGKWDQDAVSEQCGAMTMLKELGGVGL